MTPCKETQEPARGMPRHAALRSGRGDLSTSQVIIRISAGCASKRRRNAAGCGQVLVKEFGSGVVARRRAGSRTEDDVLRPKLIAEGNIV